MVLAVITWRESGFLVLVSEFAFYLLNAAVSAIIVGSRVTLNGCSLHITSGLVFARPRVNNVAVGEFVNRQPYRLLIEKDTMTNQKRGRKRIY
jgi:hypothetical protein